MDFLSTSLDSKKLSEEEFGVGFSEGQRKDESTPENIVFEEILPNFDTNMLSMDEENTCLGRNEENLRKQQSYVSNVRTTFTPVILQYPRHSDTTIEPNYNIVHNPSVDVSENRLENLGVSKTISEETSELQNNSSMKDLNKQQCENDSVENMRLNSPVNHIVTIAQVHSTPELLNVTDGSLLSSQEIETGSCQTNINFPGVSDVEDSIKDSFCNLATHCELETDADIDIIFSKFLNSCNSSLDKSDTSKLDLSKDLALSAKPCHVVLKRCDYLMDKYLTKYPAGCPSSPLADQVSEVRNTERVHKSASKHFKSKRGGDKNSDKTFLGDDYNDVIESLPGISTNGRIETIGSQEECPGNDIFHTCNTKGNPLGESVKVTKKPMRRKRNASSVISGDELLIIESSKKWKCNDSSSTENPLTVRHESNPRLYDVHNLFKSSDSEADSDYGSSKENFKTRKESKKTKNVKGVSNIFCEPTPKVIEKSVSDLENNKTGEDINLSELSNNSLLGSISNQQAVQFDYSSLIKPCCVVLTRMEPTNNEMSSVHSSLSLSSKEDFDLSEFSDLESEVEISKPKQGRKELSWVSCNVDVSSPEYSFDEVRKVKKIPNLVSFSSIGYDYSRFRFVENALGLSASNRISGLGESKSSEPADVLPDLSNAGETSFQTKQSSEPSKKSQESKKCKKSQKGKKSAPSISPDSTRSKNSGIHRELLELYKNEFTQELKELKSIVKRTEKKLDALLKLHEQVIDFYE